MTWSSYQSAGLAAKASFRVKIISDFQKSHSPLLDTILGKICIVDLCNVLKSAEPNIIVVDSFWWRQFPAIILLQSGHFAARPGQSQVDNSFKMLTSRMKMTILKINDDEDTMDQVVKNEICWYEGLYQGWQWQEDGKIQNDKDEKEDDASYPPPPLATLSIFRLWPKQTTFPNSLCAAAIKTARPNQIKKQNLKANKNTEKG